MNNTLDGSSVPLPSPSHLSKAVGDPCKPIRHCSPSGFMRPMGHFGMHSARPGSITRGAVARSRTTVEGQAHDVGTPSE
jgi:hypothetical protein